MEAIQINQLNKIFRSKLEKVHALKNLSLAINMGEVFGFLGPNGAGKSTTIKLIMGLLNPTSGTIKILDQNASLTQSRLKVGYLPEHPTFYDFMTAEEYLYFTGHIYKIPAKTLKKRAETVLKRVGIWHERKRLLRSYSKGMVQRLGIAHVLIHDPNIYILDEPMSGLDPLGRALVKEIILELKKEGKCVFLSSHIISDIETVCDRVGIISQGELLAVESVADVMEKGLIGYHLQILLPDGTLQEKEVRKEELTSFLAEIKDSSSEVHLIEPRRNDLESHFLDLIRKE